LAVSSKVFPLQIGELLPVTGTEGGVGSESVKGPTVFEGQLFNSTNMLV
jgi:hypothetical protein